MTNVDPDADTGNHLGGLTLSEVVAFDEIRRGHPEVISGEDRLGTTIRWVHIADSERIEDFLEGGELVLTTGITFRSSAAAVRAFLDQLEQASAAGLIVELVDAEGQIDRDAVEILRRAAAGRDLPIVLLTRRIKFVRITELAHQTLLAQQLARLERAREVHETFTQLSLERAEAQDIVARTAELLGAPVVLEDVGHRVLAHAGRGARAIVQEWADIVPRLGEGPGRTWMGTPVGLRERRWGRLVIAATVDDLTDAEQVIERAGQALTLARMAERDEQDLLLQAQSGLIREIVDSLDEARALAQAKSLGFAPAAGTLLVPVVVRLDRGEDTDPTAMQLRERALHQEVIAHATELRCSTLSTSRQSGSFGLVIALPARSDEDSVLDRVFAAVPRTALDRTVGVGRSSTSLLTAVTRLDSAAQVAEVAATLDLRERRFYRFSDVRLRGLLSVLGQDPRVRAFAEDELGPLLDPPDPEMLDFLDLYLSHGGNKSAVARAGYLSRPALYARIARIQDRLGVSLDDAESRTALHVALLWWRVGNRESDQRA